MWVRVATFEGGDTEKLDKLMDERMSSGEMPPPEGMRSVFILDDKDAKKRKFLALFENRETLEAAEAGFDRQGDTIPEEIRGKRTSVHYYDVVIYDGDLEAAKAARVSLLEGSPESIDAGIEKTRDDTLPKVRAISGNVGAIGLADRDNGRVSIMLPGCLHACGTTESRNPGPSHVIGVSLSAKRRSQPLVGQSDAQG